jgi:preprotein translocase subunit SecG
VFSTDLHYTAYRKIIPLNEAVLMISILLTTLHVLVAFLLIIIVLLQSGKGSDVGAAFGGGSSQTLFGSGGAAPFLTKFTAGAAFIFMITSISLTQLSSSGVAPSILDELPTNAAAPSVPATPTAEATPVPESAASGEKVTTETKTVEIPAAAGNDGVKEETGGKKP